MSGCDSKIIFGEVTKHRLTRQLEDTVWVKFINTTNRKLYAIELLELSLEGEETAEPDPIKLAQVSALKYTKIDR